MLGLQAIEQAIVQAVDQQLQLFGELPHRGRAGLAERERHAPDLITPLAVEVVEEFGEARDQIGLGEERIDRHANAQALLELLDAPSNRARVRHPLVVRRTRRCR